MRRGFGRAGFAAVAFASALGTLGRLPAGADPPVPAPRATTYGDSVIEPLREIGHVKARTPFCKALFSRSSLAITTALDFEGTLLDTLDHFHAAKLGDELNKHKSVKQLTKDLNRLADLSLAGRTELDELKSLDTDPERHEAVVGFVNALNGAKGRQMDMARKLSRTLGIVAEQPVYTNVTLPNDPGVGPTSAFAARGASSPTTMATGNILDTQEYAQALELRKNLFDAMPGDEMVGRDLRRAGENGKRAVAMGGCGL